VGVGARAAVILESMSEELRRSLRYRNYAEELRMVALGMLGEQCLTLLLAAADDYERAAGSLEAIHRSRMAINSHKAELRTRPESRVAAVESLLIAGKKVALSQP
jgi:hypothetical protein